MRGIALVAVAALCAARCFGIAASQAWVAAYVSNYVAGSAAEVQAGTTVVSSNGSKVVAVNAGRPDGMRLVIQDFADAALCATNCTAASETRGITNGCLFVWNGTGSYVNPCGTVVATSTNLVWEGVGSVATNGVERFAGWFDAYGALVQPDTSLAITNGMTEVQR